MKLEVGQEVMALTHSTSWRRMTILYVRPHEVVLIDGRRQWYYDTDGNDYASSHPYFPITWIKPLVLKHSLEATV